MDERDKYAWFTEQYQHVFDWFALPEHKNHPVLAFKLHSLIFVFSVAQFFMSFFTCLGMIYISHPSIFWAPMLCLALTWVAMGVLRLTGNFIATAQLIAFSIAGFIAFFCWVTNGFRESTFAWFTFLPILSGMLSHRLAASMWAVCIVLLNLTGHWFSVNLPLINHIHPDMQTTWTVLQQTAFLMCVGFVIYFLMVQQKISSKYLRERIISKQNLMRILVHDIANPLSTIHLSAQFLMMGGTEIPAEVSGQRIEKNANRIMNIIQLIRDMEGWEGGKKQLQLTPLNVVSVLEEVISQNQNRISSKSIKLNTTYSRDEHVWGHPTMLCEQVLGNMLSNAIKFSKEGSQIDISVEPSSRHEVTIVIRDYGVGIPSHLQKVLFDPLAHTTRLGTAGEKGTGFGLPITKSCVDLMGGRIQVNSRCETEYPQDHGTRAVLILRRADSKSIA